MRLIDIAAASSFGLLSLAVMLVLNPNALQVQSQTVAADSAAAYAILSYLHAHDLRFLATAEPASICGSLLPWNNASAVIRVSINGVPCAPVSDSSAYPGHFDLELKLPARDVKLEALAR